MCVIYIYVCPVCVCVRVRVRACVVFAHVLYAQKPHGKQKAQLARKHQGVSNHVVRESLATAALGEAGLLQVLSSLAAEALQRLAVNDWFDQAHKACEWEVVVACVDAHIGLACSLL